MPRKSPVADKPTTRTTTLVFDPTHARPWVGLWSGSATKLGKPGTFSWRTAARATGPGSVNFWPVLKTHARSMPPSRILVLTGPGSFSGTRAAVNIANALGYTWHVPVVGVHGPATLPELRKLLTDLDRTHVPDGFEVEHRALPYYPKPVQLGRGSTEKKRTRKT